MLCQPTAHTNLIFLEIKLLKQGNDSFLVHFERGHHLIHTLETKVWKILVVSLRVDHKGADLQVQIQKRFLCGALKQIYHPLCGLFDTFHGKDLLSLALVLYAIHEFIN
jgi:hypothetical protein